MKKIPYSLPSITKIEMKYAADAVKNGWGDRRKDWIDRLERTFEIMLGVKHAVATSSCTGALHLGLKALGVGEGDRVVLADTNWIATVAPLVYLKAKPVFEDIDYDTWCINPWELGYKYKAIIATHLYGNLCNMDELLNHSEAFNIPIIEDAAEALGSMWYKKYAGTMGRFGVFSFHGSKTVTTGEGGMLVTNDDALYEKVLVLANHGREKDETRLFYPHTIGFKYKMSNVQAAIGCAQMERLEELVERKREIFFIYKELLEGLPISMNPENPWEVNSFWMPTVVTEKPNTREKFMGAFKKENIDARTFFYPLSSLPMFKEVKNPNAYDIPTRAINLPSFHDITLEEQKRVVKVVKEVV